MPWTGGEDILVSPHEEACFCEHGKWNSTQPRHLIQLALEAIFILQFDLFLPFVGVFMGSPVEA